MIDQQFLKIIHLLRGVGDSLGTAHAKSIRGESGGGFADVPFDRVQAVAAVGDVSDPKIFTRRN